MTICYESEVFNPDFSPSQFDILCDAITRFCGRKHEFSSLRYDAKSGAFRTRDREFAPPIILEMLLNMLQARKINVRLTSPPQEGCWLAQLSPREFNMDHRDTISAEGDSVLAALVNAVIILNALDASNALAPRKRVRLCPPVKTAGK